MLNQSGKQRKIDCHSSMQIYAVSESNTLEVWLRITQIENAQDMMMNDIYLLKVEEFSLSFFHRIRPNRLVKVSATFSF